MSLPYESAKPGESIKTHWFPDCLQLRCLPIVSQVYDSLPAFAKNYFCYPHNVFRSELFPEPVDPITTIFFIDSIILIY